MGSEPWNVESNALAVGSVWVSAGALGWELRIVVFVVTVFAADPAACTTVRSAWSFCYEDPMEPAASEVATTPAGSVAVTGSSAEPS